MVSRRILMYEATLVAFGLVTQIESFSAQRANRRQIGHIAWRCHAITSNSEWEARNVYDDLDFLRQSIAKDQAEDRLREFQRRRLLNTFATNRRALLPDVGLFVILPIMASMLLSTFPYIHPSLARLARTMVVFSRVEFWFVVVVLPMRLLFIVKKGKPEMQRLGQTDQTLLPPRSRGLYSSLIRLDPPEDERIDCIVLGLLEHWVSAVTGTAIFGLWCAISKNRPMYSHLWPCIRFCSRLGAIASLHQYPKQLYLLRAQQRPAIRAVSSMLELSNRMLQLSLAGLMIDFSEILQLSSPRCALTAFCMTLLTLSDFSRMIVSSNVTSVQSFYVTASAKIAAMAPILFWCWLLRRLLFNGTQPLMSQLSMFPVLLPFTAPLLHLVGMQRLIRIHKTHNLSLSNKDTKLIAQDPVLLAKVIKWRYRLDWRHPSFRLHAAVAAFVDDLIYNLFFAGSVANKFMQFSKRQIQLDTKDLEKKVQEFDQVDPVDSSKWKQDAMNNLLLEHQRDYDNNSFKDPLGVAIQQTFGIGLGFTDRHMDPIAPDEEPSPRRLQARVAKSAILRLQGIYDRALDLDLDLIKGHRERERAKAELRQLEQDEKSYLARQMTELIPLVDDGNDDDPDSRVFLPKQSIRKMYRSLLQGVSEYEEPIDPSITMSKR